MKTKDSGGILIVDDNATNRDICAINLEDLDVPLSFAENGEQGLEVAAIVNPDLILLDIMMPVMDGFSMLAALKKDTRLKDIPVLMLTARSETASVVKALGMGANDYLKKPFEEEEMVARVQTLLRNRIMEKQLAEDLRSGAAMQQKFLTNPDDVAVVFKDLDVDIGINSFSCSTVSGDFYYACRQADNKCLLFVGDSCGHGLSAALISMRVVGLLQTAAGNQDTTPHNCLELLNNDICGLMPVGKFIAASCVSISASSCTIANSAQPYPVLIVDNNLQEIKQDGLPLGISPDRKFCSTVVPFNPGNRLILYSDGITEALNSDDQVYGKERLYDCIRNNNNLSCLELTRFIMDDVMNFSANKNPDDDCTMVIFDKKG